jgi:hypothetical protein
LISGQLLTWWIDLKFLSGWNVIANIRIWTSGLHESCGKKMSSFGLLELEIWTKHWTISGLQEKFRLLFGFYDLNLKITDLNCGLLWMFWDYVLAFHQDKPYLNPSFTAPVMTQIPNSVPVWIELSLLLALSLSFDFQ